MQKIIVAAFFFLSSCVTAYKGPPPDFTKTGPDATAEIAKFTMDDSFWTQGYFFRMGPDEQRYTVRSMMPIVEEVSPKAAEDARAATVMHRITSITSLITFLAIFVASTTSNESSSNSWSAIGLTGAVVTMGFAITRESYMSDAASEFNKDLPTHFTPKLGMNFSF